MIPARSSIAEKNALGIELTRFIQSPFAETLNLRYPTEGSKTTHLRSMRMSVKVIYKVHAEEVLPASKVQRAERS